jgi:uncharacterized ferritin-like protein (DUF455 family)
VTTIPLFATVHQLLLETNPAHKTQGLSNLYEIWLDKGYELESDYPITQEIIGGLPTNLPLVDPKFLKRRRLHSIEGKASLVHAIAHIEFNAINIALDAIYRFRGMPLSYYADWIRVAREEAYHFCLLQQHLQHYGYQYGDFPAHLGLWEMVQKTGFDVLPRMALVPRLLEARGLDVTPDIAGRLLKAGDSIGAEILSIIFHDEISHVRVGNRWYHYLCQVRGLDATLTFISLLQELAPDHLRGPLAIDARTKAGFAAHELDLLKKMIQVS